MTVQNNQNSVVVDPGTPIFFGADLDERILLAGTGAVAAAGGADTVIGAAAFGSNASIFFGNKGQDYIVSNGLGDTVRAGQDNDRVLSNFGNAVLYGDRDNDSIFAVQGDNTMRGGQGDDTLRSNGGNNLFIGDDLFGDEEGGDDYMVGALGREGGNDTSVGGQGNDTAVSSVNGNSFLFGNEGEDYLLSQANQLVFREEDNQDDTIVFEVAPDSLYGGKGNDYLLVGSDSDVPNPVMTGDLGKDTVGLLGTDVNRAVIGGDINPEGGMTPGTDAGDDYLFATGGDGHLLAGNIGNDIFVVGTRIAAFGAGQAAPAAGSDITIQGGQGNDIVTGQTAEGARVFGDRGDDSINLAGSSAQLWGDNPTAAGTDGFGDDTIIGSGDENTLAGDNGNATGTDGGGDDVIMLTRGSGNVLLGFGGDDYLMSSPEGNNTLSGGEGNDTYVYGTSDVVLPDGSGADVYIAAQGTALRNVVVGPDDDISGVGQFTIEGDQANTETLAGGGVITGDGADNITITGDASGSTYTNGGNDQVSAGNITPTGDIQLGAGDDTLSVTGSTATSGSVAGGDGADLLDFGEAPLVSGTITGGAGDDTIDIAGSTNANIDGGAGADSISVGELLPTTTLKGGDGDDTFNVGLIQGGAAIDGGAGDEEILPDAIGSTGGPITLSGGLGNDRVGYSYGQDITTDAGTDTSNLVLNGGDGVDVLQGSPYSGDQLSGGAGNDFLYGGSAAGLPNLTVDQLAVVGTAYGDGDRLDGGAGNDRFIIFSNTETGSGIDAASVGTALPNGVGEGVVLGTDGRFVAAGVANPFGTNDLGAAGSGYVSGAFNVDTITGFRIADGDRLLLQDANFNVNLDGTIQTFAGAGGLFGEIIEDAGAGDDAGSNFTDPDNVFNPANGAFYENFVLQGTSPGGGDGRLANVDFGLGGGSLIYDTTSGGLYISTTANEPATLLAVIPGLGNIKGRPASDLVVEDNINFDTQSGVNLF